MKEQIEELESLLCNLGAADQQFAKSLIWGWKNKGVCTPGQTPWVTKLIERAKAYLANGSTTIEPISVGDFEGVVELFLTASHHLKRPRITLSLDGTPVMLYKTSKTLGGKEMPQSMIYVVGPGSYPTRPFHGKVTMEGAFLPSKKLAGNPAKLAAVVALLKEFAVDPSGVAQKYGALTGACCFCSLKLTDPKSTAAGFGPVCAEHYGLTEQWKTAVNSVSKKTEEVVMSGKGLDKLALDIKAMDIQAPILGYFSDGSKSVCTVMGLCFLCEDPSEMECGVRDGHLVCWECLVAMETEPTK